MKKSFMGSSNRILVGLVIVALAIKAVVFFDRTRTTTEDIPATDTTTQDTDTTPTTPTTTDDEDKPSSTTPIKDKVVLSVPFTPQSPTANLEELHNEACDQD